jgi:hypothetical protein
VGDGGACEENLELMLEIHEFLREVLEPSEPSRWDDERLRILGRRDEGLDAELGESVELEDAG